MLEGKNNNSEEKRTISEKQGQTLEELAIAKWQDRLLPLMASTVIVLTGVFLVFGYLQLRHINQSIQEYPKLDKEEYLSLLFLKPQATVQETLEASRLKAILMLEANSLERSYHQANVSLMSITWIRYLSFLTGMVLALIGSVFILGKLEGPDSESDMNVFQRVRVYLRSASPGLFIAFLGVILMVTAITKDHKIVIEKSPIYVHELPSFHYSSYQRQKAAFEESSSSDHGKPEGSTKPERPEIGDLKQNE